MSLVEDFFFGVGGAWSGWCKKFFLRIGSKLNFENLVIFFIFFFGGSGGPNFFLLESSSWVEIRLHTEFGRVAMYFMLSIIQFFRMPGNSQKGLWWKILPWKDVSLLHMEMPGQSQKMGSCTLITSQVAD